MTGGGSTDDQAETTDLPVAVQMYTLRTYGAEEGESGSGLEAQLELASRAGYRYIETVGDHGVSADEMNRLLDAYNLQVASTHVGMDVLRSGLEGIIAFNKAVGNTNVVMPYADVEGAEGWQELGRELNEIGARLKQAGMQLAYHNHAQEMEEFDGKLAIDWLLGAAQPENLMWQMDVAWVARGGQDPAVLLERHARRVVTVHAKDNAPEGQNEDEGGFASVGYGVLDWSQILSAANGAGVQFYIVEHDEPRDHLTVIQRSFDFLSDTLPGILGQDTTTNPGARISSSLQTVMQLSRETLKASRAAAAAESVAAVKGRADEVFTNIWGVPSGMLSENAADAQFPGWAERWRIDGPRNGIIGHALYARQQMRSLAERADATRELKRHAKRADVSLSNVIGWMWLDDGVLYGEKTDRPRVDLTYVWDYPVEFWNTTADTGWLYEVYAQALNILKTDYEGDVAMAQKHAQALVPLLEKAMSGVDQNGNGKVEPTRMEGGLETVMAQARAAGWTAERATR